MPDHIPFSLAYLHSHSIFNPSSSPPSTSTLDDWEFLEKPSENVVPQKHGRIVMRDKDLIVAVGHEIRMTSLSSGEGWEVRDGRIGNYKVGSGLALYIGMVSKLTGRREQTLKSPHLTFTIHQLVLNPTKRLLAVVGETQLVVVVLPKTGFSSSVTSAVTVRSFVVDAFSRSKSSSSTITKVDWHPWGLGNSLWVLTTSGKLFEYDVLRPSDPVQTFDFLTSTSNSPSRFSAADPLSTIATSFSFSKSLSGIGWEDLMVYVLLGNGDVFLMGPILPFQSEIPLSFLRNLKCYTETRLRREKGSGRLRMQDQWVDAVLRQVDEARESESEIDILVSRRHTESGSPEKRKLEMEMEIEKKVLIRPPHLTEAGEPVPGLQKTLLRQGPIIFEPSPDEITNEDEDEEQVAVDLVLFQPLDDTVVLSIAWSGGRVDLGLVVEKPEPRWLSVRDNTPSDLLVPIIESVLLPLPTLDPESIAANAPVFSRDPIHKDVIYVQHAVGVDAICVSPWAVEVQDRLESEEEGEWSPSEVVRLVESASTKPKPIVGIVSFCNITLGYGLLALASTNQLAAVELDFRMVKSSDPASFGPETDTEDADAIHDEQSLLSQPVDFDVSSEPFNPKLAIRGTDSKPLSTITPAHLRTVGELVSLFHQRISSIRKSSQLVQHRLDIQISEYQRQVKMLTESSRKIRDVRDVNRDTTDRAERLLDEQEKLMGRLERVIAVMTAEYKPEVGPVERRWFEELERLKLRVAGGKRSMMSRAAVLKEQLDVVRPYVGEGIAEVDEGAGNYGSKQLRPLEMALSARSTEIKRLMGKMEALNIKVESAGYGDASISGSR
ncbi:nucleoporin NUP82, partial [Tremellales sp. Uapishka_1]